MHRRTLLQLAWAGTALSASTHLLAAHSSAPRFLLVFLRGGYDAANLLIPSSSSFYRETRPNIALPAPSDDADSSLALNSDWALHPALKDTVFPLAKRGQATFIPFAGTDDSSRSHFETQDAIELGQASTGRRDYQSGFMNRLAQALDPHDAISFTDQLPLCFRGAANVGNISLKTLGKSNVDDKMRGLLADMYRHQTLSTQVQEGFNVRSEVEREVLGAVVGEMPGVNRNAINARGFELEARRIAKLMRDKYALGFIDIGGWDTHVNQGAATGYLATRFEELGRGLAAYAEEMGSEAWRKTVVVVVSEFGRTLRENGNRGTDHGHGSVYWVLGGSLASPVVAGEQTTVEARTLFQNRDFPVFNDYRALLAGLMQRQFGLSAASIAKVFPGATAKDLGLI